MSPDEHFSRNEKVCLLWARWLTDCFWLFCADTPDTTGKFIVLLGMDPCGILHSVLSNRISGVLLGLGNYGREMGDFFFLGPYLRHMEVPGRGVKSELQPQVYTTAIATWDRSYICDLYWSLQQCWILNPLSRGRDQTCILIGWATVGAPANGKFLLSGNVTELANCKCLFLRKSLLAFWCQGCDLWAINPFSLSCRNMSANSVFVHRAFFPTLASHSECMVFSDENILKIVSFIYNIYLYIYC